MASRTATRASRIVLLSALAFTSPAVGQDVAYGIGARSVAELDTAAMRAVADRTLAALADEGSPARRTDRANAEIAAGRFAEAGETIRAIRAELDDDAAARWLPAELYAGARAAAAEAGGGLEDAYRRIFLDLTAGLDDLAADRAYYWFGGSLQAARASVDRRLARHAGAEVVGLEDALGLLRSWTFLEILRAAPLAAVLIADDEAARYHIEDDVLITTPEGVTLSATVARPRRATERLPTALTFTIYADPAANLGRAKSAAAYGYAGVVVDARGKRLSPDEIVPYEVEVDDTYAAIDWIVAQPWSNGEVGMIGGSYEGFTAWAATKRLHPALKTIATSAAAIPGLGLPMENNVFLNANYGWAFYVTNNRLLDYSQNDFTRWAARNRAWYESGLPYREIDRLDGGPNPWLQRWLDHPDYDAYWQAMVPYGEDFEKIDIPILTITGYYDDAQISALHYTREHYRHNPDAEHYVVIGPYDHAGTHQPVKPTVLRGYAIDPVAQFSTPGLEFEWLDHVLRGGPRPTMLEDRINFQVMGGNRWEHAASLDAMADERWTLYLTDERVDGSYRLTAKRPAEPGAIEQLVDFADRSTTSASYYPNRIVDEAPDFSRGLVFMTDPLAVPIEVNGAFSAALDVTINKRDFDVVLALHELKPDGSSMPLSHYIGRASYAEDMSERRLLTPGEPTRVAFDRTRVTSRRVEAGSRLVVVVDVLKNGSHQINYGTGGDVSDESIADATEPLRIRWRNDSFIRLPVSRLGGR